uniref:Uncharacterized protein LOC100367675 n=1 Tax=Saccoglossus kowalevskii TaxID=10224 RepID=A0ABM0MBR4_SACKO|nr:PREDICTED: uncharacterized protein LOC100367675 [Saccoglossus kowalevskii]
MLSSVAFISSQIVRLLSVTNSLKERFHSENTLICLLQALTGKSTVIELRNESTVTGVIDSVDAYMNVFMSDVEFVNADGQVMILSNFFVQGKMIRFVQIPDEVNIVTAIKSQLSSWQERRTRKERVQRRNKARAQLQAVLTPIEELITQYPDANDKNAAYREILAWKLAVDNRLSALVNADQQVIDHYDEDHAEFTETESYEVEIIARFARLLMFVEEFQTIRFQQPVIQQAPLDHNMAALQPDQQIHYKSVHLPYLEIQMYPLFTVIYSLGLNSLIISKPLSTTTLIYPISKSSRTSETA